MSEVLWPTAQEAARQVGVSDRYIRMLIENGTLTGHLRGHTWLINPESLKHYEETRDPKPGRKKKQVS